MNFAACDKIMRAADLGPFGRKNGDYSPETMKGLSQNGTALFELVNRALLSGLLGLDGLNQLGN